MANRLQPWVPSLLGTPTPRQANSFALAQSLVAVGAQTERSRARVSALQDHHDGSARRGLYGPQEAFGSLC